VGRRPQGHLRRYQRVAVAEQAVADAAVDLELGPTAQHRFPAERDGDGADELPVAIAPGDDLRLHRRPLARDGALGRVAHRAPVLVERVGGEGAVLGLALHRIDDGRVSAGGAEQREEQEISHTLSATLWTLCAPTSRNFLS